MEKRSIFFFTAVVVSAAVLLFPAVLPALSDPGFPITIFLSGELPGRGNRPMQTIFISEKDRDSLKIDVIKKIISFGDTKIILPDNTYSYSVDSQDFPFITTETLVKVKISDGTDKKPRVVTLSFASPKHKTDIVKIDKKKKILLVDASCLRALTDFISKAGITYDGTEEKDGNVFHKFVLPDSTVEITCNTTEYFLKELFGDRSLEPVKTIKTYTLK